MIKGKIKFTENGFILYPTDREKEIWEKGSNSHEQYIYFNNERYKWINPPKKVVEDLDEE
jgi:hypothetical protein